VPAWFGAANAFVQELDESIRRKEKRPKAVAPTHVQLSVPEVDFVMRRRPEDANGRVVKDLTLSDFDIYMGGELLVKVAAPALAGSPIQRAGC